MSFEMTMICILIGGYAFGKLASAVKLPGVLGMTIFGIILAVVGPMVPSLAPSAEMDSVGPALKSLALVIILLRAGLGIHVNTLKKIGTTALLLSFMPMTFEALWIGFLSSHLFDWTIGQGMLLGFMLAAVSPAVVVPSMLQLKEQRRGEKNDVPTLVLAGASLDDVYAITLFTMVLGSLSGAGQAVGAASLLQAAGHIVFSVVAGIIPGVILGGLLVLLFRKRPQSIRATEKALLLLGLSFALYSIGQAEHTAALLGVMTVGFLLLAYVPPAAGELADKLSKVWIFAEIMLFVLIGMAVDVDVALSAGLKGLAIIFSALVFRAFGVLTALIGSKLSVREKVFVVISYIPKATVQAALGAVPLAAGIDGGEQMLALAVLAILITAPLGLVGIRLFGHRLLDQDFQESTAT